ncbi:MAG TPA: ABC transporter permease [Blastocatellia bacterium]|jgi:predicted permease|nr:ABC transporter permease [Blastocatellia bacterium]
MLQDLRFGMRMLIKNKALTIVAVLSLALGIGANTAIFSLLDVLLLREMPVRQPERLVFFGRCDGPAGIEGGFPSGDLRFFSSPFFQEFRRHNHSFSDVAALYSFQNRVYGIVNANRPENELERINAQMVSGNYFSILGVNPIIGRIFTAMDDRIPGGHPVVVASHNWWMRRFGGAPSIIGKSVVIGQTSYTIIGIAPKEFFGTTVGESPDIWAPLSLEEQLPPYFKGLNDRFFSPLYLIARLNDGVTIQQAGAETNLLARQILHEYAGPQLSPERLQEIQQTSIELTPAGRGLSRLRRQFSLPLQVLMLVAAIVLFIACANLANLLLARATARRQEFAVRIALGASRWRLARQLLAESLLLAVLGGTTGILLGFLGSRALILMVSTEPAPLPLDVSLDLRILIFTTLISLLSTLFFGASSAIRASGIEPLSPLQGNRATTPATTRLPLGKALIVSQVALSLLLLAGTGLFVRTLINLQSVDLGFNRQNALLFQLETNSIGSQADAQLANLYRQIEERVKAIPGVQAASFSASVFDQGVWGATVSPRGPGPGGVSEGGADNNAVGPGFFKAMGLSLLQGREFGPQDTAVSPKVAVINESLAQRFFPGSSPVGRRFGWTDGRNSSEDIEVIGVVKDFREQGPIEESRPMVYHSYSQRIDYLNNLVVRYSGEPRGIVPEIRKAIKEVNRRLPIVEAVTMSEHVDRSLVKQRLVARLSTFFGLLALLLACVGLYGVMSYAVARRTNEIGVRMALGAMRGDVIWLVLREALALVGAGVVIGLLASLAATKTVSTLLYGLRPNDPLTIAAATLLLLAVAALSAYLPARRASRVDPMAALREE